VASNGDSLVASQAWISDFSSIVPGSQRYLPAPAGTRSNHCYCWLRTPQAAVEALSMFLEWQSEKRKQKGSFGFKIQQLISNKQFDTLIPSHKSVQTSNVGRKTPNSVVIMASFTDKGLNCRMSGFASPAKRAWTVSRQLNTRQREKPATPKSWTHAISFFQGDELSPQHQNPNIEVWWHPMVITSWPRRPESVTFRST